ncbi:MAG: metal ABC transporter substrate-binding protein [Ilumatobacteraceae bacterium]
MTNRRWPLQVLRPLLARRLAALATMVALGSLSLACSTDESIDGAAVGDTDVVASQSTAAPADTAQTTTDLPDVVVTYSVLAALVRDLVDGVADVVTVIPDGQDPHTFEPSAKDIATLNDAALVVANGLDLEAGLDNALANADESGTKVFFVTDHVTLADLVDVNDHAGHDHDHPGADSTVTEGHDHSKDPHVWLSPATMREALPALAQAASEALGTDLTAAASRLDAQLQAVDAELTETFAEFDECELVTGHNELGYFAQRYGCEVIAAILPSAATSAEESAGAVEFVIDVIRTHEVAVIFPSLGSSGAVAERVADSTGARIVEVNTHFLGSATSYVTFITSLGDTIAAGLRG